MNELKVFSNTEFGTVRTVTIDGEPWFVGSDIAKELGYSIPSKAVTDHCKHFLKRKVGVQTGVRQDGSACEQQIEMNVIPESDLYRLVMKSKLPSAERFSDWVFDEVLPSIRRNGGYIAGQEQMTNEQIIANALVLANKVIEDKNKEIAQMQPKSDYFDRLVDSKLLTTFRDCAKEFNMKPGTFTNWLRENGYIYNDRHNIIKPYQTYVESGLFSLKDFNTPYGYSNVQTYVTVKGKETFRLLLGIG